MLYSKVEPLNKPHQKGFSLSFTTELYAAHLGAKEIFAAHLVPYTTRDK
jgi:hypothetical protein